jgi:Flp pilus assembly protein TadD
MSRVGLGLHFALTGLVLLSSSLIASAAPVANYQVCDVAADFALGREDYFKAIVLHRALVRSPRNSALVHYHLGFAYGMVGRVDEEIAEYLAAIRLGLEHWDLFLNLGLAYLGQRELVKATAALETAVLLGAQHPEAHFELAIAYEQAGRLPDALHEIAASLRLKPQDPDELNIEALIYAELGDLDSARKIWTQLVMVAPEYAPARANLEILNTQSGAP